VTSTYQARTTHSHGRPGTRLIGTAALLALSLLALSLVGLACTLPAPTVGQPPRVRTGPAWRTGCPRPLCAGRRAARPPSAPAQLPLNYNDPHGATIQVALLRIKAKDPRDRLGTIFVNPGGPGDSAGSSRCSFADAATPARFARLAALLRARPLRLAAPGVKATTFTYADLIADTEHWLHDPGGYQGLFPELTDLARLTVPGGSGNGRAAVVRALLSLRLAVQSGSSSSNYLEAQSGIMCADALQGDSASSWPAAAAAADRKARYFGAYYAWLTVQCARNTWTAHDADVFRGPFDRRTSAPVLVIGNRRDPVTSYDSAVKVARMLPSSRLVSGDSGGHTALLTSACVDNTVWGYLLHPLARAPKATYCRGDVQPFASSPSDP
jgi:pimeloyl-ACP methyl ester carboxylesterase